MANRRYYSLRNRRNHEWIQLDLPRLKKLFLAIYQDLEERGYFQQAFGYSCVDGGTDGRLGRDKERYFFLRLRKPSLWPMETKLETYTEADLFDVIELLHDLVSKPLEGVYHNFSDCGWHYHTFDEEAGKTVFREEMNQVLLDYQDGYELSRDGEILQLGDAGLASLLKAELPQLDPENVEGRVQVAVRKFRRHHSSLEDRREAVRALADVLEFLRPRLKGVITNKDDDDLFNLANNFGLRHHTDTQKTKYDQRIWLSWMFYYYLATIHAVTRLLTRGGSPADSRQHASPP